MVGKVTPNHMASASIISAILGQDQYKTPNDALRNCVNASLGIKSKEWVQSKQAAFGDRIEGFLAESACKELQGTWLKTDYEEAFFHQSLELACSLDASCIAHIDVEHNPEKGIYVMTPSRKIRLDGEGIIECKNTSVKPGDGPSPSRGPLQLQAQLMCTGMAWGCVATLYGGYDLRLYIYDNDPSVQALITARVNDFSRRVKEQDFYAPDSSEDCHNIWPVPVNFEREPMADLPDEIDEIVEEIEDAKRLKKAMDAKIDACQQLLKTHLGNHSMGVTRQYQLDWPMGKAADERLITYKAKDAERVKSVRSKKLRGDQNAA